MARTLRFPRRSTESAALTNVGWRLLVSYASLVGCSSLAMGQGGRRLTSDDDPPEPNGLDQRPTGVGEECCAGSDPADIRQTP